ncbi:MAG TPA: mechanosensitive ion channel domain-containing protein [Dokdonella sp.]
MIPAPDVLLPYLLKLAAALAVLAIGFPLLRRVAGSSERIMVRRRIDPLLAEFVRTSALSLGVVVLVLASLQLVGVPTTSFLTVLGAAGLAVGLALKDSLSHLAAGVMLIVLRPFRAGDYVRAGSEEGTIVHVRLFQTVLRAPDNRMIVLPNGLITAQAIVNFSECDRRRTDFNLLFAIDTPIEPTLETLRTLVAADERILKQPAPFIAAADVSDRGLLIQVQIWTAPSAIGDVRSALLARLQRELGGERLPLVGPGATAAIVPPPRPA